MIVLDLEDRPGALAEAVHKLGVAGVNPTLVYLATQTGWCSPRTTWPMRRQRSVRISGNGVDPAITGELSEERPVSPVEPNG